MKKLLFIIVLFSNPLFANETALICDKYSFESFDMGFITYDVDGEGLTLIIDSNIKKIKVNKNGNQFGHIFYDSFTADYKEEGSQITWFSFTNEPSEWSPKPGRWKYALNKYTGNLQINYQYGTKKRPYYEDQNEAIWKCQKGESLF